MKPLLFFAKEDKNEIISLSEEALISIVEQSYQSGLDDGKAQAISSLVAVIPDVNITCDINKIASVINRKLGGD